jgi:ABC-type glutathione transport system ATPase component
MASAKIVEICGKNSAASPPQAASDWVYALKDVSFEVKRGELRTPGRSEKEISKKCLGATKVPASGRRRHQLLGIIGHNGAGTQTAWQPLGRLPKAARKVNRDLGKVEKDCHQAAPKEKQIRQFANQTPREGANQHHAVEDAEWVNQAGCGARWVR